MPDGLVDIGGGFKVISPDAFKTEVKSGTQVATEYLGLMNLQNQIKDYPIERLKKEADLTLAQNKVDMIGVENDKLRAELESAVQGEIRSKIKFWGDTMVQSLQLGAMDPGLGFAQMSKVLPPGSFPKAVEGKPGAYNIIVPTGKKLPTGAQEFKSFLFDPNKITDPNQRLQAETNFRKDFEQTPEVQRFSILHSAYATAQNAIKNVTGANDLALYYATIKSLDPTSSVMQGELANATNTRGISESLLNKLNQYAKGAKLGPQASKARQELADIVAEKYNTSRMTVKEIGRNNYRIAEGSGLKGASTIRPVGDLTANDFLPIETLAEMPADKLTKDQKLDVYNYLTNPQGQ